MWPGKAAHGQDVNRRQINTILIAVSIASTALLVATQAGIAVKSMPDTAQIYVDGFGIYASPPCVLRGKTEHKYTAIVGQLSDTEAVLRPLPGVRRAPMSEVLRQFGSHARPDPVCGQAGGFSQTVTVWQALIGAHSRWTEDGTWRW
jgi:hypothetical protein